LAVAEVVAVAVVDNNWWQKRLAMRGLMVALQRAMTKADGGQQCNN
jgi:hypothetical protein